MNNINKKNILLYSLNQLGLIILEKSGVTYQNQVGGYSCIQKSEEGILVIIEDDLEVVLKALSEKLQNITRLSVYDADSIDFILHQNSCTSFMSVDRDKLQDSMEAWVYVDIFDWKDGNLNQSVSPMYPFGGFGKCKGVLTWNNSD